MLGRWMNRGFLCLALGASGWCWGAFVELARCGWTRAVVWLNLLSDLHVEEP